MKSRNLLYLSAILLTAHTSSAQETAQYRLEAAAGRIVVDQAVHFSSWTQAHGTIENEVNATGAFAGIRPRFWRRDINALQSDIVAGLRTNLPFRLAQVAPDDITIADAVVTGHLNSREAVLAAFDDRLDTWWEPVFPESRSADLVGAEAFFAIDLGRMVLADKIVLKFAEEEDGDPFLLFDVFTSDGINPVSRPNVSLHGETPEYLRVFSMLRPNKSQREVDIDLTRFDNLTEQEKRLVNWIRVSVTGSAYERGRQVTLEEYEDLRQVAPQDTGMVEHTRRLSSGALIAVDQGVWEDLQGDDQGPIRYWQRERPRLVEIQVWAEGENIFEGVPQRCASSDGNPWSFGTTDQCLFRTAKEEGNPLLFPYTSELSDGDHATRTDLLVNPGSALIGDRLRQLLVDLGSMFWVDSYRHTVVLDGGHAATFGHWAIDLSDGSVEPDGSLAWNRVHSVDEVSTLLKVPTRLASVDFETQKARFLRLEWLQTTDNAGPSDEANVSELQLFGEGYQPQVRLVSDAIPLPGNSNLVSIEWEADTPAGTSVSLRTRTGTELDTEYCFYSKLGGNSRELVIDGSHCAAPGTERLDTLVEKFPKPGRGAKPDRIDTNVVLIESKFSPWSEVYLDASGSPFTSPSPRQVMLISATLQSDDPDLHATLESVTVNFDDPVANRLLGSLTPTRVEALGVDQAFSLVVQLDTLQLGMDELLLLPPAGMKLVRDPAPILYTGTLEQLQDGQDMSALDRPANVIIPDEGTSLSDSLYLSFAAIDDANAAEAIRLEFTGRLFSPGGRLNVQLRNSTSAGGNWQRVDQERNSLVLLAQPATKELFRDLALVPQVFTPNGDDRNDEMQVSFTLLSVGVGTGVVVEVYDLSGHLVRRLEEQRENSTGAYAIPWDGRDGAGNIVAPGVYAVRVKLSGATAGSGLGQVEQLRTVAVAY